MAGRDLLEIEDLKISFPGSGTPVRGVSFTVGEGEVVGIAGESGSGKTLTALSVIGLLPHGARVSGSIRYDGQELLGSPARQKAHRALRGRHITMVFQETVTALNPVVPIGRQLVLAVRTNHRCSTDEAVRRVEQALREVMLHDTDRVMHSYPHQLSGGMCQRVMIAMALGCGARLLLADEPTTALDVTVQREVLEVLRSVVREHGLSVLFISHDLGVLDEIADRLVVMYRGEIVEQGPTPTILNRPSHPYTRALLASIPRLGVSVEGMAAAKGAVR